MSADVSLRERYVSAGRRSLVEHGESAKQRGYDLGREALRSGVGLLEMVSLQHEVLRELSRASAGGALSPEALRALTAFFVESLAPFEMVHRGFRDSNEELRRLNERLNVTLEQAMTRVAHILHDQVGQVLVAAHLALEDLARDLPPTSRGRIVEIRTILEQIEEQLRSVSRELRPTLLDDLGLMPAVEALASGVAARGHIGVDVSGANPGRLPQDIETAAYRIVQEALTNVLRHAHASHVRLRFRLRAGMLAFFVHDDGVGFELEPKETVGSAGLGLVGIRERAKALGGCVRIHSRPDAGCKIFVALPMGR
ncbi:MAG TPA: ATP-binding protein [Candidatus Sulfotelmatobacter sp.]|jgi:signal transduction histidine kinase|nr:ATP-binding protein [Candidatus Sulfotelmatobacter sp.]